MQLYAIYVHCADDSFNILQIPAHLQLWSSESRKIASMLQMPAQNSASAMRFSQVIGTTNGKNPWCTKNLPRYAAVQVIFFGFDMPQAFYSVQIFASERCKIIKRLSETTPNLENIMQFADVSFVLMQILCDGRVQSNELMLHKTMQCTGVSCKAHQIVANTEQFCANATQPRDPTKRPKYCTLICLVFWYVLVVGLPFNRRNHFHLLHIFTFMVFARKAAYTQGCLSTWMLLHRDAFYVHPKSPKHGDFTNKCLLCTGAFSQGCFYRQELLHTDARVFLHTDAFAQWCFYTRMLLPTSTCAFTGGFFWHKVACTHRSFYTNWKVAKKRATLLFSGHGKPA